MFLQKSRDRRHKGETIIVRKKKKTSTSIDKDARKNGGAHIPSDKELASAPQALPLPVTSFKPADRYSPIDTVTNLPYGGHYPPTLQSNRPAYFGHASSGALCASKNQLGPWLDSSRSPYSDWHPGIEMSTEHAKKVQAIQDSEREIPECERSAYKMVNDKIVHVMRNAKMDAIALQNPKVEQIRGLENYERLTEEGHRVRYFKIDGEMHLVRKDQWGRVVNFAPMSNEHADNVLKTRQREESQQQRERKRRQREAMCGKGNYGCPNGKSKRSEDCYVILNGEEFRVIEENGKAIRYERPCIKDVGGREEYRRRHNFEIIDRVENVVIDGRNFRVFRDAKNRILWYGYRPFQVGRDQEEESSEEESSEEESSEDERRLRRLRDKVDRRGLHEEKKNNIVKWLNATTD